MQTLAKAPVAAGRVFGDADWERLSRAVADTFRMSTAEHARFSTSPVAKLIAAIPHLAGVANAERSALAHLVLYATASGPSDIARAIANHLPADDGDVMQRLSAISRFDGGNPDIIHKGMCILGIVLVSNYVKDLAKDKESGEYNPVGAGKWDAEKIIGDLTRHADAVECPHMDGILNPSTAIKAGWYDTDNS